MTTPAAPTRPAVRGAKRAPLAAARPLLGGPRTGRAWRALGAAAGLALAGLARAEPPAPAPPFWLEAPPQQAHASTMGGSLAELAAHTRPAVLALRGERRGALERDPGLGILRRRRGPSEVRGSAFLISADGYALTVSSLVEGTEALSAQLPDGRMLGARVVGADARGRIALLKLEDAKPFPALALGNSHSAAIGDWVIALGHADERDWDDESGAAGGATLAKGVVAGTQRRVENAESRLLQTDLVLVRGYSGAPLVDMNGGVIGILDQELQPEGALGISFAIPIDEAKRVLHQLRSAGRVERGWLGVQIQTLTPALVSRLQLGSRDGALVSDVLAGTPAEAAGLHTQDVILELDGEPVEGSGDLPAVVSRHAPGAQVKIAVLREGHRRELTAVLGSAPEEAALARARPQPSATPEPWGFSSETATAELAQRYGLPPQSVGFVVTAVEPAGPADRAGLAPGDLLREANGTALRERAQLDAALESKEPLLRVQRGSSTVYRVLERH